MGNGLLAVTGHGCSWHFEDQRRVLGPRPMTGLRKLKAARANLVGTQSSSGEEATSCVVGGSLPQDVMRPARQLPLVGRRAIYPAESPGGACGVRARRHCWRLFGSRHQGGGCGPRVLASCLLNIFPANNTTRARIRPALQLRRSRTRALSTFGSRGNPTGPGHVNLLAWSTKPS